MSAALKASVIQTLFHAAWNEYEIRTGTNLDQHPIALQLQTCDSFQSLISLLQEQAQTLNELRGSRKVAVVNLFRSITNFLHRLDIYINIPPTAAMAEIVVNVLVESLSTLVLAAKQNDLRLKEVEAALQRLDRLIQDEARTTAAQTFQIVYGLVRDMSAVAGGCKASTDGVREALTIMQKFAIGMNNSKCDELRQGIQTWLSPPDSWENHGIALKAHRNGTSAWFIQSDTFSEWKSSGSLLWIHGKLGCGKTILCSAIIEAIDSMRRAGLASLAFFYFDRSDDKKRNLRSLLSSLVLQLYDQSDLYFNIVSDFHSAYHRGSQYPSDAALIQCLVDILNRPGQAPIYIILDGIDECPKSSGRFSPRGDVLMFVEELVGLHLPNLHICVSSRPEFDIKAVISPLAHHSISLHDEAAQKEEIVQYIRFIVDSNPRMRTWAMGDKELVINVLSQKADGMFRWITCQLDILPNCFSRHIQPTLDEVPATLCEIYERALEDIPDVHWESAHLLLQCVLVSSRPLLVEELAEFLAFDFDTKSIPKLQAGWRINDPEDALLSMCPGLFSIVEVNGSKIVQFPHFSVKQFLISNSLATAGSRSSRYHIDVRRAHTMVVQTCLAVLLSLNEEVSVDSVKNFPLANYAAWHWVHHVQSEYVPSSMQSAIQGAIELILDSRLHHFSACIYVIGSTSPHPCTKIPSRASLRLHYPILYGCRDLASFLFFAWHDAFNDDNSQRYTPLTVASALGHISIVRLLLQRHGRAYAQSGNNRTAVHFASRGGHLGVAQFLLKNGASADSRDNTNQTPLHFGSQQGCPKIVQLLLEHGADTEAKDDCGRTPLHSAVMQGGHLEIIQLLLEHGADPKAKDLFGHTPLHYVVMYGGHLEIVRLLVDCGAYPNTPDGSGQTPLHHVSRVGHLEIAQFLLVDCDTYADTWDETDRNPLHCAAEAGHLEISQLLLEHGADKNARDIAGWTPLHLASQAGHLEIIELLLDRDADANARNDSGQTALHLASQDGFLDVVLFLLARGVSTINVRDYEGRTPSHEASVSGHHDIARLLSEHGG